MARIHIYMPGVCNLQYTRSSPYSRYGICAPGRSDDFTGKVRITPSIPFIFRQPLSSRTTRYFFLAGIGET